MFVELPQELILYSAGAFLLGWLLSSISSRMGARYKTKKRDPRDDRIRELEAELRIAHGSSEKSKTELERLEDQLKETTVGLERRDYVISDQQAKLEKISADLKESVLKTRELRAELADRATQNVHAEAKIREVETELSVAQASTDLIATGVLDYSLAPDKEDGDSANEASSTGAGKAVPGAKG
jgi:chromosome segregation ATPase